MMVIYNGWRCFFRFLGPDICRPHNGGVGASVISTCKYPRC
jgi:hypothetical protein